MKNIQVSIPDSQCNYLGSPVNTTGQADWIDEAGNEYDRCVWGDEKSFCRYESQKDFEEKNPVHMYILDEDGYKPNPKWIAAPFHTFIYRQRGSGNLFMGCHSVSISEETCCKP
jgi:hypothetical protein